VRGDVDEASPWAQHCCWPVLRWALSICGGNARWRCRCSVDLLRIPVFALRWGPSSFCAQMLSFIALPFLLLETYGRSHFEAGR
jgi:DHA2 family multidrug resistance protein-like MFS transporter